MVQDQEFLEFLIKALVDNPQDVKTERKVDEMGVLITLKVDPTDMGYIIGRQGGTARAFRTLLRTVGAKNNSRVNLKIYEPEGRERPPRRDAPASFAAPAASAADELDTSAVDSLSI